MFLMKTFIYTACLICFCAITGFSQGIEFFDGSWEDAKKLAAEEEKLLFVDAYAQWCGPCKRMAKTVFTNPSVGEYFGANFVSLKIDMEKEKGIAFGKTYPVRAFPTLLFINPEGEVLKKVVGAKQVKDFLDIAKKVISSYDRSGEYAELYEKGDRSFDLVLAYVKALNKANKSSIKVSNDFLRNTESLTKGQKAEFLFEALTYADSRIFDLFIVERPTLVAAKSEKAVEEKIEAACWNTIHNAINFEIYELVEEAKSKMKEYCNSRSKQFVLNADYEYSKGVSDGELLSKSAQNIASQYKNSEDDLRELAEELLAYSKSSKEVAEASEKIAKMAMKKGDDPESYIIYAKSLMSNNKHKEALKTAKKARDKFEEGYPRSLESLDQLIDEIERDMGK